MNKLPCAPDQRPATARRRSSSLGLPLLLFLTLAWASVAQAQYITSIENDGVTITRYTGEGGDVTIPATLGGLPVKAIGNGAFQDKTTVTSVTIPGSVTAIGWFAFSYCTGLTSVTIPGSVTSIRGGAFSGCTGLTSVTIPNGVTSIGEGAFARCTGLTSVTIPNSVTSIGSSVFAGCTGLISVTILDSVTSIGDGAFGGCTGLTSVTIPDSVTAIGWFAFYGCTGLTSVTIPKSVTDIGNWAFSGCTGLSRVYFSGNAPLDWASSFQGTQATVYYLQGTTGWGTTFNGRPTVPWSARIVTEDGQVRVLRGHFIFTLAGVSGGPVVVEANDQLGQPWLPVSTNTFNAQGLAKFTDPSPADRPGRMYRLTVP